LSSETPGDARNSFGERLTDAFNRFGHLCVGIDPHPYLLDSWGLPDTADGAREFGLRVVDAAAGRAGIVKPQVAFFERFGSVGFAALEAVLSSARATDLLVIADAKRGDIGTTADAYGAAWLTPGSPLEVDALTVNAFQGVGSLSGTIDLALASGKGLFVLTATSNPESADIQTALVRQGPHEGATIASSIVAEVNRSNAEPRGSIGVVIGATVDLGSFGIDAESLSRTPILAPGFGYQGATFASISDIYGRAKANVLVSSSRAILESGHAGIATSITAATRELAEVFVA
jgi:orotidine-5'-phosphate decarboxylase